MTNPLSRRPILCFFLSIAAIPLSAQVWCDANLVQPGTHFADPSLDPTGFCGNGANEADWRIFDAPQTGTITISSCGAGMNTNLTVFTGTCVTLQCIAFGDDDCPISDGGPNLAAKIENLPVTQGSRYYIRWDNLWEDGSFQWSLFYDVSNDDPCQAAELPCDGEAFVVTSNATSSGLPAICGSNTNDKDAFYKFTALPGNEYYASAQSNSSSLTFAAYTGLCDGTLSLLECAEPGAGNTSLSFDIAVDEPTDIILRVMQSAAVSETVAISLNCEQNNYNCSNATPLFLNDSPTFSNNSNAFGGSTNYPNVCGFGNPSTSSYVWYSFTAPPSGNLTINALPSIFTPLNPIGQMEMHLVTACEGGEVVDCISNTSNPSLQLNCGEYTPGATYYIGLRGSGGSTGAYSIQISSTPCPPPNSTCSSASGLTLNASPLLGTNLDAPNNYLTSCAGLTQGAVYYNFVAPVGEITLETGSPASGIPGINNTVLSVISACFGGTTLGCDNNSGAGNYSRLTLPCGTLNPGSTYTVVVSGVNGAQGAFSLSGSVGGCLPNDFCEDALPLTVNAPPINQNNTSAVATPGLEVECATLDPVSNSDLWYSFTAPASGIITIETFAPGVLNTTLQVFASCGGPVLFCDDNSGTFVLSKITMPCGSYIPGQEYLVQVDGVNQARGPFSISVVTDPCAGFDCEDLEANFGDTCDDGNSNTSNDVVTENCTCEGSTVFTPTTEGTANWNSNCPPTLANMRWYEPGTDTEIFSAVLTLTAAGTFTIPSAPIGTYDVIFNANGYLPKGYQNQSFSLGMGVWMGGSLIKGDVNNDNAINIIDVSVLNANFGLSQGIAGFNPNADLNCDGTVNITDVSLLNAGFGLTGPLLPLGDL